MSKQKKRYLKKGFNPEYYITVYFGAEKPNFWYVRIGGLETDRFRHGIALSESFASKEEAEQYKQEVIQYLAKAFKINWKKN